MVWAISSRKKARWRLGIIVWNSRLLRNSIGSSRVAPFIFPELYEVIKTFAQDIFNVIKKVRALL